MADLKKKYKSTLKMQEGIQPPPSVNPDVISGAGRKHRRKYSVDEYVTGILSRDMTILSQAITLVESSLSGQYDMAQSILEKCLPFSSKSLRIGITGVPGAGKSSFIETFGLYLTSIGRKLAVLTVDPSSEKTKGSILGDKTRMEQLAISPDAFIRTSPASGNLGGVARKTRETIVLCEAAGFDTILVETVGVGQSETQVQSMVDFFLLLMLAGAGDEIQGLKRGIIEMADLIAVTKADGPNKQIAEGSKVLYQNALNLFPLKMSGWKPQVVTCSALNNTGITELWKIILDYVRITRTSGYFDELRQQQAVIRMNDTIIEWLNTSFNNNEKVKLVRNELEKQLWDGKITSYKAALVLLDKFLER